VYTSENFRTKKALKQAIADGKLVTLWQSNDMFGCREARSDFTGEVSVEGPHFPQAHSWYARVSVENGRIVKVK
jgi:hypothetical protein